MCSTCFFFFFFNDTATTEIYTLSLHDALPISSYAGSRGTRGADTSCGSRRVRGNPAGDRKSARLNSSHSQISYAVFCLKKKKKTHKTSTLHGPQECEGPLAVCTSHQAVEAQRS